MITVVNQRTFDLPKHLDETVSIARPGIWGNSFLIGRDGTREEVIEKYRQQLWENMNDAPILDSLSELAEKANKGDLYLACWCAPEPCHGDVLKEAIEWMQERLERQRHRPPEGSSGLLHRPTCGSRFSKRPALASVLACGSRRFTQIGITGHRDYEDRENIITWMRGIAKRYPSSTVVTGGALGVDLIAAEEAIEVGLKSKVILPMLFDVFTKNWGKKSKARLQSVLDKSEVIVISVENAKERLALNPETPLQGLVKYEPELLFERNQAIVDESNILIAFWDGRQSGGTFDTVKKGLNAGIDVFQGIPCPSTSLKKGKTRDFAQIEADTPLADEFKIDEACIEGWEALQERVGGWQHFGQEAVLCDYECNGGVVYERHEVIGDEEPETAVAARVYASCLCFPWEAKQIAAEIMDFGLEYESYWRGRLKVDFDGAWKELSRLAWGMAQEAPSPLDALEHEWKQSYNDDPSEDTEDVVVDPTHGWHRVGDGRDFIDAELPLPSEVTLHSESAQALFKRMSETQSNGLLRSFGKELYETQKAGKIRMPNTEWTWLWNEYKAARDGYKVSNGFNLMSSPLNVNGK